MYNLIGVTHSVEKKKRFISNVQDEGPLYLGRRTGRGLMFTAEYAHLNNLP